MIVVPSRYHRRAPGAGGLKLRRWPDAASDAIQTLFRRWTDAGQPPLSAEPRLSQRCDRPPAALSAVCPDVCQTSDALPQQIALLQQPVEKISTLLTTPYDSAARCFHECYRCYMHRFCMRALMRTALSGSNTQKTLAGGEHGMEIY